MGRKIDILASLVCIAGGIYLLSIQAVAENSILESIAHGIGIYFVGKGLFVARSTHLQTDSADSLDRLTKYAGFRHDRETRE